MEGKKTSTIARFQDKSTVYSPRGRGSKEILSRLELGAKHVQGILIRRSARWNTARIVITAPENHAMVRHPPFYRIKSHLAIVIPSQFKSYRSFLPLFAKEADTLLQESTSSIYRNCWTGLPNFITLSLSLCLRPFMGLTGNYRNPSMRFDPVPLSLLTAAN